MGLIKIDGLEPTDDFLEMVEKEIKGEITLGDIKKALDTKYKMKGNKVNIPLNSI